MAAVVVRMRTIHKVIREFLDWRGPSLESGELALYSGTLKLFIASIDGHGSRRLAGLERRIYRANYVQGKGYRLRFSEVFGPEKIPSEVRYFLRNFLGRAESANPDIVERAPTIIADLCAWLVWRSYVPESEMEEAIDQVGSAPPQRKQDFVNF